MKDDEPTQETEKGQTIPIPFQESVFADVAKVAKAKRDDAPPRGEAGHRPSSD